jgi:hypothetical protein
MLSCIWVSLFIDWPARIGNGEWAGSGDAHLGRGGERARSLDSVGNEE